MRVFLDNDKLSAIQQLLKKKLGSSEVNIQELAKVTGTLEAAKPAFWPHHTDLLQISSTGNRKAHRGVWLERHGQPYKKCELGVQISASSARIV